MTEELKRWVIIMFPKGMKGKVNLSISDKQLCTAQEAKERIDAMEQEFVIKEDKDDNVKS